MANRWGKKWKQQQTISFSSKITTGGDCSHSILKSRDATLLTKVLIVKTMVFAVVMYGCERWTIKKLSTKELMLLNYGVEESPLDCKKVKPVNSKGSQPRTFIGRTDAEAETSILWPPDAKNSPLGKDPDARKDLRKEEKGMIEDEMVG